MARTLIFLLVIALAMAGEAQAAAYLHVMYDNRTNTSSISVIEDTMYYVSEFYIGETPTTDYAIKITDRSEKVLASGSLYPNENNFFNFTGAIKAVAIERSGVTVFRRELGFCDNDEICEPCRSEDCVMMESRITCGDCATGGEDRFCDLERDGICDPDCDGMDMDCAGCNEDTCFYRDTELRLTKCKDDLGGEPCLPGEKCAGELVYADDTGSLCCQGECGNETGKAAVSAEPKETKNNNIKYFISIFIFAAAIIVIALLLRHRRN